MKHHNEFIATTLNEIRIFLLINHSTLSDVPKPLANEVKQVADRVKKSRDSAHLRNYLLEYIELTSSFWRAIAPFTLLNKLRHHLERVITAPDFSPQAIQVAQISSVHEYYLVKQKELIEPLQIEIQSLQGFCQSLQHTVTSLREENQRLRIENDFFMKELVTMQTQTSNKATIIMRGSLPPFIKEPPADDIIHTTSLVYDDYPPVSVYGEGSTHCFG